MTSPIDPVRLHAMWERLPAELPGWSRDDMRREFRVSDSQVKSSLRRWRRWMAVKHLGDRLHRTYLRCGDGVMTAAPRWAEYGARRHEVVIPDTAPALGPHAYTDAPEALLIAETRLPEWLRGARRPSAAEITRAVFGDPPPRVARTPPGAGR